MKKYFNKTNLILIILLCISFILFISSILLKFSVPVDYSPQANDIPIRTIQTGDKIESIILSAVNNLESLKLQVKKSINLQKDNVYVSIYDEKGNKIYYNDLTNVQFFDTMYFNFKFDRVKNSLGKKFKLIIEAKKIPENCTLELLNTTYDIKEDTTTINGNQIENDLAIIQYGYAVTNFYKGLFTIIILVLLFIFFRYNFKSNNKLKEFLLRGKKVFFIQFASSLLAGYAFLNVIYQTHYLYKFPVIYYGLFLIGASVLIFIYSIYLGDKSLKKEDLFLLLAIPISMMYFSFLLPLNVPDELYHYKLAYKLSLFKIFSVNIPFPKNVGIPTKYNQIIIPANYQDLVNISVGDYHPLLYLFSGMGILVSKLLNTSVTMGMYFGRMANLLIFLILGYYIIKKIPFGKWVMIIYLLNPMFLQQATSFSADAMINIFSMLFISYVLYIRYDKQKIEIKDFLILLISYLFIFVGKYAYIFLGLLFILIWKELKEFIKKHKRFFILSLLIFLLISCGWIFYTKIILKMISHSHTAVSKYKIPQKVDTKLSFILKNPVNFIPIYFKTLLYKSDFYVRTFLGCSLGYFHIQINMISTIVYAILLIFSIFITQESKECDRKTKIVNSIIFVVIFNIILLGLYIGWGIITDITIEGVQGRYFIPIAILLLLIPIRKDQKIKMKNVDFIIAMIFIINHILIVKDIITCFLS